MKARNTKLAQSRPEGGFAIRVFHRKAQGKKSARLLLKCGCCDGKLEIHYSDDGLEINGVNGSVENWREILTPLLSLGHGRDSRDTFSTSVGGESPTISS